MAAALTGLGTLEYFWSFPKIPFGIDVSGRGGTQTVAADYDLVGFTVVESDPVGLNGDRYSVRW